METRIDRSDAGMALVLATIFMVGLTLILGGVTLRLVQQDTRIDRENDMMNALEGLEAALSMSQAELLDFGLPNIPAEDNDGLVGVDPTFNVVAAWQAHVLNGVPLPGWDSDVVKPVTIPMLGGVEFYALAVDWATDGLDNNLNGLTDVPADPDEFGYFSVFVSARSGGITRSVESIISGQNVNVWQNAIFAGVGQGGGLINGNVSIHGSVHLLGDNLGVGGVALSALDLSGASLIHNNYEGLSADLRGRIPPPPTTTFNGQIVETLNATLRVKNGLVGMSGSSEVGEADDTSNAIKETMDGVFVNDGWTGTDVVAGDPKSVHSDNGWEEDYDLSNAVPFPTYNDDNGRNHLAEYLTPDPDPNKGFQSPFVGNIIIDTTLGAPGKGNKAANPTGSFYFNSTTMLPGDEIVDTQVGTGGIPKASQLPADEHYIWYDSTTKTLVVNGRVAVDGNLVITGGPGDVVNYTGKGTIMTYDADLSGDGGNVQLSASLKTTNFPDNLIGVMAQNQFNIGTTAQMEMMGGFYSQGTITVNKQTTIVGTIVGNFFNMGSNVPDIYQVPAVVAAWTDDQHMIGSNPVIFLAPLSWKEQGTV